MTSDDLQTLLDYHYWARDRLLDAIDALSPEQFNRDLKSSFKSIRETAAHLYAAEWAWFERWNGRSPSKLLSPDVFPDAAEIRRQWTELEGKMRALIAGLGDDGVSREIDYTLLSGRQGRNTIAQMLPHVVNHASYHRGQITTMLRQLGAEPPKPMDLIAYYRTR